MKTPISFIRYVIVPWQSTSWPGHPNCSPPLRKLPGSAVVYSVLGRKPEQREEEGGEGVSARIASGLNLLKEAKLDNEGSNSAHL